VSTAIKEQITTTKDLRSNLSDNLNRVYYGGNILVVERKGVEQVVMIEAGEFRSMQAELKCFRALEPEE
jgi:PHD/YefM family antitoxin component YafN of YafNO toxin-antitoxin module